MTTPQNPGTRRKQKVRRTKKLTAWRAAKANEAEKKAPAQSGESLRKASAK